MSYYQSSRFSCFWGNAKFFRLGENYTADCIVFLTYIDRAKQQRKLLKNLRLSQTWGGESMIRTWLFRLSNYNILIWQIYKGFPKPLCHRQCTQCTYGIVHKIGSMASLITNFSSDRGKTRFSLQKRNPLNWLKKSSIFAFAPNLCTYRRVHVSNRYDYTADCRLLNSE